MQTAQQLNSSEYFIKPPTEFEPRFTPFIREVSKLSGFNSRESFNKYCRAVLAAWDVTFPDGVGTTKDFASILKKIENGAQGRITIPTPWGGVLVEKHDLNLVHIEKFLAVKRGGYLHFETHEAKDEKLEVREGAGVLIYRPRPGSPLTLKVLVPGVTAEFKPGEEHCIIGTEDLLVYESSIDRKGMDKDLIFIFEADAPSSKSSKE